MQWLELRNSLLKCPLQSRQLLEKLLLITGQEPTENMILLMRAVLVSKIPAHFPQRAFHGKSRQSGLQLCWPPTTICPTCPYLMTQTACVCIHICVCLTVGQDRTHSLNFKWWLNPPTFSQQSHVLWHVWWVYDCNISIYTCVIFIVMKIPSWT